MVEPARLFVISGRRIQMSKTVFVVPQNNWRLKNRCQNLSKCIVKKLQLVGSANSVFKIFETAVGACMQRPGLAAVLEFMFVQPGNRSRLIIWWWIYNKKLISKRSGPDWSWFFADADCCSVRQHSSKPVLWAVHFRFHNFILKPGWSSVFIRHLKFAC